LESTFAAESTHFFQILHNQ